MTAPSPHLPSISDIVTISRIPTASTSSALPPSLPAILSPLLRLLRTPDVRSYLLSPHPHHISTLLSPTLSASSHLFSYVATRASPLLPAPLTSLISHFDMQFLYAPTLAISNVIVGAGIMHSRACQCPVSLPSFPDLLFHDLAPDFGLFRFAIDPALNLCLMLYTIPNRDAFLVFYSQIHDTRSSTSACLIFSHSQLLPLLISDDDPSALKPEHVASSVLYYAFESGRNPCGLCHRTDRDGPCACVHTYETPMHPLDTHPFISLVRPHTGKFEFTCHEASVRQGRVLSTDILGVREKFEGFVDGDVKRWILEGALRKYFEGLITSPQKGLGLTGGDCLLGWGDTGGGEVVNTGGSAQGLAGGVATVPALGVDDVFSLSDDDATRPSSDTLCAPPISPREFHMPLAPAVKPQRAAAVAKKISVVDGPDSRAHVWARRRERNRLSAQRSNLKRKLQLESLEAQLKSGREKVGRLRARELALRKENLELRGWCK